MADLTGLLTRARACRRSLAGLDEARASEHERRPQLIAEMRSAGCSWGVITDALGISAAWASEILSTVPDPAELAELHQSLGLDQPASAAAAELDQDQDQAPEVDKSDYSRLPSEVCARPALCGPQSHCEHAGVMQRDTDVCR